MAGICAPPAPPSIEALPAGERFVSSPERLDGPVPLALDLAVDHVGLELLADLGGALAAHAHQPDAAGGKALDRRHSDLLGHAADHDDALIEVQVDDPAHSHWPDGSSLRACSSKWSASASSEVRPARVRD